MEHLLIVDDLHQLRQIVPGSSAYVQVAGCRRAGDGGDGLFRWALGDAPFNGGTVVQSAHREDGRWHRLFSGPINVRWFGAAGDGSDCGSAIQAAVDAAADGGTILLPSGNYLVCKPIKLHQGITLQGDGLLSILNYSGPAGTGCIQSDDLDGSQKFHLARMNVEVQTEGAFGIDLRGMSYSRFDDLSIHLRSDNTTGFHGPGNTRAPYYNLFTGCHVAGTANMRTNGCVGFDFTYDAAQQDQSANANTIIGGRISTCQQAVRCYGTGNTFYGQVLESNETGYLFDVVPSRRQLQQVGISNDIIGCYSEHVDRVIVQKDRRCYTNALLTMVTGYQKVFDAVDTSNCVVITSHDGSLPTSRSFVDRLIDFKRLTSNR